MMSTATIEKKEKIKFQAMMELNKKRENLKQQFNTDAISDDEFYKRLDEAYTKYYKTIEKYYI